MKIRVSPLLLGSFIVGVVILVIAALLAFGAHNPFKGTAHFASFLPGSGQGLDKGTAVSLNGVNIGEVNKVEVIYDERARHSSVRILCEITAERLSDSSGKSIRLTDERELERLIQSGLRAQLATAGLVGAKFINLNFYNPAEHPIPEGLPESKYPIVPAVPSTTEEMMKNVAQFAANLRKVDLAALAGQAKAVLASLDRQVSELQTNRLTDHLSTAAESIGRLSSSTNLNALLGRLHDAAANLDVLVTNVNSQVGPLAHKADDTLTRSKATLASIGETARDLQDFVALRNELGEQTRGLEEQLTQTARTIEQLAAFLQQHPNALLTGRTEAPDTP